MRSSSHPVRVKNDSGEEIPAYAVMVVTGSERMATKNVALKVEKIAIPPTAAGRQVILVNGPCAIGTSGAARYGWARHAMLPVIDWVAYEWAFDTPAPGEMWGISDGAWLLGKDDPGFLIVGEVDEDNHRVQAMFMPDIRGAAELTATMSAPSAFKTSTTDATAKLLVMNAVGDLTATGAPTITVRNRWPDVGLASGKHLRVEWDWTYLEWVPYAAECST